MSGTAIVPSASDSQKKYNRIIAWVTGLLTLSVAVLSFLLSFTALVDLAAQHRIGIPVLFPLIVEAGVVIFSLNAMYRSLQGERARWQWGLVIGSALLAGIFNVLHAPSDVVSRIMAAMPSLFLVLSFETFLSQVKYAVQRSETVRTLAELDDLITAKQAEFEHSSAELGNRYQTTKQEQEHMLEQLRTDAAQLTADIELLRTEQTALCSEIERLREQKSVILASEMGTLDEANAVRSSKKTQAKNDLLDFLVNHPDATLREAGNAIERSKSTVSDYLSELVDEGQLVKHDNGWEVRDGR
ncbi:MAG: DUF2637 domain-containing protein [Anaerolineae bacterium]|nr:DUF2637 domain-containing protein [Anaerolineae bacterium]